VKRAIAHPPLTRETSASAASQGAESPTRCDSSHQNARFATAGFGRFEGRACGVELVAEVDGRRAALSAQKVMSLLEAASLALQLQCQEG